MRNEVVSAYIMILVKRYDITPREKEILKIGREYNQLNALKFVNESDNKLLYTLYQGFCIGEKLLNDFFIRNWTDDVCLIKRTTKIVRNAISDWDIKQVAKLLRMLYFEELVTKNIDPNFHDYLQLYLNVFDISEDITERKRLRF
jgi:hypothetical protein